MNIKLDDTALLVVKVGTTLVSSSTSADFLDRGKMGPIVEDISDFRKRGIKVILVSSGAIGAGMAVLGLKVRPKVLPRKQAAAAIGQSRCKSGTDGQDDTGIPIFESFFRFGNI